MAATAIAMPKLGMTMEEGTVIDWPLAPGATVEKGQLLLENRESRQVTAAWSPCSRMIFLNFLLSGVSRLSISTSIVTTGMAALRLDKTGLDWN